MEERRRISTDAQAFDEALRRVLSDEELVKRFWHRGYEELTNHAGNNASQWIGKRILAQADDFVPQFGVYRRALPTRSIVASATMSLNVGPCAVASVRCVTPGSVGSMTIDDSLTADATRRRFSRVYSDAVAGTDYQLVSAIDQAAMLFDVSPFVTVPTGGVYVIEVIVGALPADVQGAGMLCVAKRITATGIALRGAARVVSLAIIDPGSSGNLAVYDGAATTGALRYPSTVYSSLTAGQLIKLGPPGGAAYFNGLYLTVPTGAVVLVNYLPGQAW